MGGKVEGHGETLLSGSEVAAVEGVRLLSGGESGILADSPWTEGVHHRVRAAEERRNTGGEVEVLHTLQVFLGIDGFHFDMLRRLPVGGDAIVFLPLCTILFLDAGKDIYVFKIFSHDFEITWSFYAF